MSIADTIPLRLQNAEDYNPENGEPSRDRDTFVWSVDDQVFGVGPAILLDGTTTGLSLSGGELALASASASVGGAMSAADYAKLNLVSGLPFYVDRNATGGAGTTGSPWTGFETALIAATTAGKLCIFSAGFYKITATLTITGYAPRWRGEGKAVLRYVNATAAPVLVITNTTGDTNSQVFGAKLENLWTDGGGTATYGVDTTGVHHSIFDGLVIGNVVTAVFRSRWAVTNKYRGLRSHPADGWTVAPVDGLVLSGLSNNGACVCTIEGLEIAGNGVGIGITGVGVKMDQSSFGCVFEGGGVEGCATAVALDSSCRDIQFNGFDMESCGGITIAGVRCTLINCDSLATPLTISGSNNTVIGGRYASATVTGHPNTFVNVNCGVPTCTGTGAATVIGDSDFGAVGSYVRLITATSSRCLVGTSTANQFFAGDAGKMQLIGPSGSGVAIGAEDTGTSYLGVGTDGVTNLVLAKGFALNGKNNSGIHDLLSIDNNEDVSLRSPRDVVAIPGSSGHLRVYVSGATYALTLDNSGASFLGAIGVNGATPPARATITGNVTTGTLANLQSVVGALLTAVNDIGLITKSTT